MFSLVSKAQHGLDIERWDGGLISYGVNLSKTSTKLYQIGGDISILEFQYKDMIWYGGYADCIYNKNYSKLSVGPKFGYWFVGCDLAYYSSFSHKKGIDNDYGIQARLQLSAMLIHPYFRVSQSLKSSDRSMEFGFMIKMLGRRKRNLF